MKSWRANLTDSMKRKTSQTLNETLPLNLTKVNTRIDIRLCMVLVPTRCQVLSGYRLAKN